MNHSEQCDNEMQHAVEWECDRKPDANPLSRRTRKCIYKRFRSYTNEKQAHQTHIYLYMRRCIRDMLALFDWWSHTLTPDIDKQRRVACAVLFLLLCWRCCGSDVLNRSRTVSLFRPLPLSYQHCLSICLRVYSKFNRNVEFKIQAVGTGII